MGESEDTPASRAEQAVAGFDAGTVQMLPVQEDEGQYRLLAVPLFSLQQPYIIAEAGNEEGWNILLATTLELLETDKYYVFDLSDGQRAILVDGEVCWQELETHH